MSNDLNNGGFGGGGAGGGVSVDEVSTQLRSYGRWLADRSDVEVAAPDVDLLDDLDGGGFAPSSRPRLYAGLAAAAALVVVVAAGLGLGGRSGSGEQLEAGPAGIGGVAPVEQRGDTPTSETGSPDRPAVGTDGEQSGAGQVPESGDLAPGSDGASAGDDDELAPAESGDAAPGAEGDGGRTTADGSAETVADPADAYPDDVAGDDESTPDIAITPSTVDVDVDDPPWNSETGGTAAFLSPTNGAVLDLNQTNTLRAEPVAGATTYVFEGWQNGVSVMSTSGNEPSLILPSRLITTGVMARVQPGSLQLTVSARDAAGNVLGTSRIDVTILGAGGGPSGRDVMGDNPFPSN